MHVGPGDLELLRQLKQQGISMGFDTTGFVPWENIQAVLPYTDFFLWDIKAISPEVHRQFTGADNELILNNLSKADEKEMKLYIRIPVIPGVNDNNLFFQQLTGLLKSLDHVEQVHLMPLHHLGTSRYQKIGREDPYEHVEPIPRDMLEMRCMEIGRAGFQAKIIG